jgi:two-component system response regulator FlrC
MTLSNRAYPVILIEDDDDLREAIGVTLRIHKIDFFTHQKAETVIPMLQPGMQAMIVTDYKLPGMNGVELLKKALEINPNMPIIVMTAFADAKLAVEALKAGAKDFLIKPFIPEQLVETIARYQPHPLATPPPTKASHNAPQSKSPSGQQKPPNTPKKSIIAVDPAMLSTLSRCERVAPTNTSVLITGESGVGKEVIAQYTHERSPRAEKPFIALNCAAIPETLLESILFGHEKGSFTGASKTQAGKFEQANGGTLFLDEIGEMPPQLQAKLLRVLQDQMVEKLGSTDLVPVDVRIIAATNRNLMQRVQEGHFREDLYFRLAVFPIHIPELRHRTGDILPLAEFFLARYSKNVNRENMFFSGGAQRSLLQHNWPGNVRELENTIQRAVLMTDDEQVLTEHLELYSRNLSQVSHSEQNTVKVFEGRTDISTNSTNNVSPPHQNE